MFGYGNYKPGNITGVVAHWGHLLDKPVNAIKGNLN
jgi:hypothetical protein